VREEKKKGQGLGRSLFYLELVGRRRHYFITWPLSLWARRRSP
jgi:hypothetical protein